MSAEDDDFDRALAEFVADFKARHPHHYDGSLRASPGSAGSLQEAGTSGLSRDEEEFLHGKCHLLAVALNELTGLPLGAYLDEAWVETPDGHVEMVVLVHAFVVDGDEAIDIRGRVPLEDVLEEFDFSEPWFVNPSVPDLVSLGEGRKKIGKNNPRYVEALRHAEALAERLQLPRAGGPPGRSVDP